MFQISDYSPFYLSNAEWQEFVSGVWKWPTGNGYYILLLISAWYMLDQTHIYIITLDDWIQKEHLIFNILAGRDNKMW